MVAVGEWRHFVGWVSRGMTSYISENTLTVDSYDMSHILAHILELGFDGTTWWPVPLLKHRIEKMWFILHCLKKWSQVHLWSSDGNKIEQVDMPISGQKMDIRTTTPLHIPYNNTPVCIYQTAIPLQYIKYSDTIIQCTVIMLMNVLKRAGDLNLKAELSMS